MTACMCPSCCALPAPTYTEEFKRECLDRYFRRLAAKVLAMPTLDERRWFIAEYKGDRARLEAEILKLHQERKNA